MSFRGTYTCDGCDKERAATRGTALPPLWVRADIRVHDVPSMNGGQQIIIRELCGDCTERLRSMVDPKQWQRPEPNREPIQQQDREQQDERPLRAGDIVECISACRPVIMEGERYTVHAVGTGAMSDQVFLKGLSGGYFARRFKRVAPAVPEGAQL